MTKSDLVVEGTRHHLARLLKYYPRRPCAPSFVKSRTLRPLQRHFLLFQQQIFFILVCIHVGNPRMPPRPKPCGGKNQMECATTPLSQQARERKRNTRRTEQKNQHDKLYCNVTVKKHLRSSSHETNIPNILNSLWCWSLIMKTTNNPSKDELVSDGGANK